MSNDGPGAPLPGVRPPVKCEKCGGWFWPGAPAAWVSIPLREWERLLTEMQRLRAFIESLDHQYSDCRPGFVCVPECQACAGRKLLEDHA